MTTNSLGFVRIPQEKPTAYVDEMIEFLFDEYGVELFDRTLFRTLEAAKWTRKVAGKHAKERNEALRAAFYNITWCWDPVQVVAIDESAANEWTADRKRGWGPASEPVILPYFGTRARRSTVISAMGVNGYFAWEILDGSLTKAVFEWFLEIRVIPNCGPYPGPRSIILMDNASAHRSLRVQALCEQAGILLYQVPPYSPDYNPIEQTFRVLKIWIRRN
jgi:transposase